MKERESQGKNPFYERLKKFTGKQVKVHLKSGKKLEGTLVAVNFATMNFIVEGANEEYVIRDDVSFMEVPK